jgi:hypothetical protein
MTAYKRLGLLAIVTLFILQTALAQPAAMSESGMNAAMVKLFGGNTAFSARAEFRVLDAKQEQTDFMPANYACLDGNTRMDVDLTQIKSVDVPAMAVTALKQLAMDQAIIISRPDKKLTYNVYPHARAYAAIAMDKNELVAQGTSFQMDKSPIGSETIDGHSCQKSKVTLSGDKGQKLEATVWTAPDLKDFPVQIQMSPDAGTTLIIKFRDLKLARPDTKDFEPPAGYTKYESAEALRDAQTKLPIPDAGEK